jgi:tetratricopeptide (TPR) repeat protein
MLPEPASPAVRVRALGGASQIAVYRGDFRAARTYLEEARAICEQTGDRQGLGFALHRLAHVSLNQGDMETAGALCLESLDLWRNLGEKPGLAFALITAGFWAQRSGQPARALAYWQETLDIARETGNRAVIAYATGHTALAYCDLGDYARSRSVAQEALTLQRARRDRWGLIGPLRHLMRVAQLLGDAEPVPALSHENLTLARALGSTARIDEIVELLAWYASERGQPEQAARLLGAAEAHRGTMNVSVNPANRPAHEQLVATVRTALGNDTYEAVRSDGESMTFDDVLDYAATEAGRT